MAIKLVEGFSKSIFICWGLASFFVLSCSHLDKKGSQTLTTEPTKFEQAYPNRIIDAHSHFSLDSSTELSQPTLEMQTMYRESNVQAAVVHLPKDKHKRKSLKVERAKSQLKLAVCAAVVPGESSSAVEQGIQRGDYQCMKVYLGYIPKYASDPFYHDFYRLAEKYQLPVVFHTGDTYDKKAKVKFAEPLQIDEIALQYPKVNFVLAHMGNPWIQSAAEVVYKNDNVFVDVSALMLGDVSKANPEALEELAIKPIRWFWLYVENPKKMMFGSDWPLMEVKPYVQAVMKAIPKEHWDDVFFKNAAEVFKLN